MAEIHNSILEVMSEVSALPKDRQNAEGWSFRSIDALSKQLQPIFVKQQVSCTCEVKNLPREPLSRESRSRSIVTCRYTLTSAKDGSSVSTECYGEGECLNDKATPKAMTGAWKQMFLQLFMIPVADELDPDKDSLGVKAAEEKKSVPVQPPAKPVVQSQSKPVAPSAKPAPQPPKSEQKPQPAPQSTTKPTEAPPMSLDEFRKAVARMNAGVALLKPLCVSHNDDFHEVDSSGKENPLTLIERVDNLGSKIYELPPGSAERTQLQRGFDDLLRETQRDREFRKGLLAQITSGPSPDIKAAKLAEAKQLHDAKKLSSVSYDQVVNAYQQ